MESGSRPSRRAFLRGAAGLSALGLASRIDALGAIASAHAQTSAAAADYKALVCVFLFGGNDGNNTIVPVDTAGYGAYAAVRPASSGIQLAQAELLPIEPLNLGTPFGLHPALPELQALFAKRRMAIVANVGTLTGPTSKLQYAQGMRPDSLYSHADQQAQWQSAVSAARSATGWGGRLADQVAALNPSGFPVITSLGGNVLFATGDSSVSLAVPASGSFALQGYGGGGALANTRRAALKALLDQAAASPFVAAAQGAARQALALSDLVNPILVGESPIVDASFATLNSAIAQQLHQVAKVIAARSATGARRQVFFVQLGGFDTHSDQANRQRALFAGLSPALKAFYDATSALGVAGQVTTFTLSDFGRTFQPASGGGTDHAWGSHHFVIGDAVNGGMFYGRFPQLALGGPDDAEKEGRWIPGVSVDQLGATLARWFGVSPVATATVFPNVASFDTPDLGFMA